jgi:hypothetical protein
MDLVRALRLKILTEGFIMLKMTEASLLIIFDFEIFMLALGYGIL